MLSGGIEKDQWYEMGKGNLITAQKMKFSIKDFFTFCAVNIALISPFVPFLYSLKTSEKLFLFSWGRERVHWEQMT